MNTKVPGRYTMTYSVSDASGNNSTATREIIVEDDGGGGAFDPFTVFGLLIACLVARRRI